MVEMVDCVITFKSSVTMTNSFRVVGDAPVATIPPVAGSTKVGLEVCLANVLYAAVQISEGSDHGTLLAHQFDNGPERQRHERISELTGSAQGDAATDGRGNRQSAPSNKDGAARAEERSYRSRPVRTKHLNTANFPNHRVEREREKYLINTHTNILFLNGSEVLNIEIIHNANGRNGGLRQHLQVIRHHVHHTTLHKPPTTFIPASRIRLRRSNIRHLGTNVLPAVRTNSFRVVGDAPAAT
nr:hypothetical protein Itr_chr05CG20280 [Ipomoea trifida]